jgi:hypothetical protein
MIRWRTAARQGVRLGALAVVASILANGTFHGWKSLTEPNFWLWEMIVFSLTAMIATALFWSGLWRGERRNETSDAES